MIYDLESPPWWKGPEGCPQVLQLADEFEELRGLFRKRQPRCILEIGVHLGGTLWNWITLSRPGALIVALDVANGWVEAEALSERCGHEYHCVLGDSRNAVGSVRQILGHRQLDWLFIDGGHREEDVRADWDLYAPMVGAGGVVVFHDIVRCLPKDDQLGIWKVWEKVKARSGCETREILSHPDQEAWGYGVVFIEEGVVFDLG